MKTSKLARPWQRYEERKAALCPLDMTESHLGHTGTLDGGAALGPEIFSVFSLLRSAGPQTVFGTCRRSSQVLWNVFCGHRWQKRERSVGGAHASQKSKGIRRSKTRKFRCLTRINEYRTQSCRLRVSSSGREKKSVNIHKVFPRARWSGHKATELSMFCLART